MYLKLLHELEMQNCWMVSRFCTGQVAGHVNANHLANILGGEVEVIDPVSFCVMLVLMQDMALLIKHAACLFAFCVHNWT